MLIFACGLVVGWVIRTLDSYYFDPRIQKLKARGEWKL